MADEEVEEVDLPVLACKLMEDGDWDALRALLKKHRDLVDKPVPDLLDSRASILLRLLESGAPMSIKRWGVWQADPTRLDRATTSENCAAVHIVARHGMPLVSALVRKKVSFIRESWRGSPLQLAIQAGHMDTATELLAAMHDTGMDLDMLASAVRGRHWRFARQMLLSCSKIDIRLRMDLILQLLVTEEADPDLIHLLLRGHTSLMPVKNGLTLQECCAQLGCLPALLCLRSRDLLLPLGEALTFAIRSGSKECVELLLETETVFDMDGRTGMMFAVLAQAEWMSKELVARIVGHPCMWSLDLVDYNGDTPLGCAVHYSSTVLVSALIAAGADVHYVNRAGRKAIHSAVSKRNWTCMSLLLDAGCALDDVDHRGMPLLHYIVRNGRLDLARCALDRTADQMGMLCTLTDREGRLAVSYARTDGMRRELKWRARRLLLLAASPLNYRSPFTKLPPGPLSIIAAFLFC